MVKDSLIPIFKNDEIIEYQIKKVETFRFKDSLSDPFERSYNIELRRIEEKVFEIYFPDSFLSGSKHFNSLGNFLPIMKNEQNSTLYISLNDDNELNLKNDKAVLSNLKHLKTQLLQQTNDDDIIDNIEFIFDELTTKESVAKYFFEDIEPLFEYYGFQKLDDQYIDLKEEESTSLGSITNKLLKKIKLGVSTIHVVMFDKIEDNKFKIEAIAGTDTISTFTRQDFEGVKENFLNDELTYDALSDLTIHHKKYIYNSNNLLEEYNFRSKTDTKNMRKVKELSIHNLS